MKNPCQSCVVTSCCTELCSNKKIFNYIILSNALCYSGKHHKHQLVTTLTESRNILRKSYPHSEILKRDVDEVSKILLKRGTHDIIYHIYIDKMTLNPLDIQEGKYNETNKQV